MMSTNLARKCLDRAAGLTLPLGSWRRWLAGTLRSSGRVVMRLAVVMRKSAQRQEDRAAQSAQDVMLGSAVAALLDDSSGAPPLLQAVDRLTRSVALYGGGAVLAFLVTVLVVDVIGRYLLNAPLAGAMDLSIVALVLVVSASLAYAGRAGAHVTADMLTTIGSPRTERIAAVGIKVLAGLMTAVWSWRLWLTGGVAERLGEGTQLLNLPYGPIYKIMSVGVGLFSLVLVLELLVLLRNGRVPVLDAERPRSEDAVP